MHNSRIGHVRLQLVMTDEMRRCLMDLATGNATTVVIPQAMVQHMLVHHCRTQASRIREMQYRKVSIDRLELTSGPMGTPFTMS